jgi:hypothetical protein
MMNLNTENHGKIGLAKAEDTMIYLIVITMGQIVNA